MTHEAEYGKKVLKDKDGKPIDLHPDKKDKNWYNHRGFFEHKLSEPGIYDHGKSEYLDPKERLRMPDPHLPAEWRTSLTTLLLGSRGIEGANVPKSLFYAPADQRRQDIQNGWWVIKKYNCMGCHVVQPGQTVQVYNNSAEPSTVEGTALTSLPFYATNKDLLPPMLTSEGARVDPEWLMRFLKDPSLMREGERAQTSNSASAAPSRPAASPAANASASPGPTTSTNSQQGRLQTQPGANRNGVRPYLGVHMPTFSFSPNELRMLVRFFIAVSSQNDPYIKEPMLPLD